MGERTSSWIKWHSTLPEHMICVSNSSLKVLRVRRQQFHSQTMSLSIIMRHNATAMSFFTFDTRSESAHFRPKCAQNEHFLSLFFAISGRVRCLIAKPSRDRNNLPKYYKKHYYCFGVTPVTFEKIAKNTSKKLSITDFGPFRGGLPSLA